MQLRNTGNFKASDLANMDQTPLTFVLDHGNTYDKKRCERSLGTKWTVQSRQKTSDCPIDSIC